MKSEHRHDLKTNELGRLVAQATPFLEKYSNHILIGLGVAVVAAALAIFFLGSTSTTTAGWSAMLAADTSNSVEEFAAVADKYPNTQVGDWAALIQAEAYLEGGIRNSFSDRARSNTDLERAQKILDDLSGKSSAHDALKKRVLYALARCAETRGDVGGAIDLYSKLVSDYDDQVYDGLANERIKDLETAESKDFYAWFRKQNPKPEDRAQPQDGAFPPGQPPVIMLPEIPKILQLPPSPEKEPEKPAGAETPSAQPDGKAGVATPPLSTEPKSAGDATAPPQTLPAATPTSPTPSADTDKSAAPASPTESKEAPAENPAPSQK